MQTHEASRLPLVVAPRPIVAVAIFPWQVDCYGAPGLIRRKSELRLLYPKRTLHAFYLLHALKNWEIADKFQLRDLPVPQMTLLDLFSELAGKFQARKLAYRGISSTGFEADHAAYITGHMVAVDRGFLKAGILDN